mmetsp:Transcript_15976/g.37066  ORF Transcript_15976/g.37066 Transcript_15976/m.37066 type:complete len:232 (-) Transcript_15976:934-1629(-)
MKDDRSAADDSSSRQSTPAPTSAALSSEAFAAPSTKGCLGSTSISTASSASAAALALALGGGGRYRGVGHRFLEAPLPSVKCGEATSMQFTASSSSVTRNCTGPLEESSPAAFAVTSRELTKLSRFLAKSSEAVAGRRDGRSVYPIILTPFSVVAMPPACEPATLPPVSLLAAMSSTTDPGRMPWSISWETSLGAGLPGTSAVVIITSASAVHSSIFCRSASLYSSLISFA